LTVLDEMTAVRHGARYDVLSVYALERYTTSTLVLYSISKLADEQSNHKTISKRHSQPPIEQSSKSVYLASRSMNWNIAGESAYLHPVLEPGKRVYPSSVSPSMSRYWEPIDAQKTLWAGIQQSCHFNCAAFTPTHLRLQLVSQGTAEPQERPARPRREEISQPTWDPGPRCMTGRTQGAQARNRQKRRDPVCGGGEREGGEQIETPISA
jgi:hypothetical protein